LNAQQIVGKVGLEKDMTGFRKSRQETDSPKSIKASISTVGWLAIVSVAIILAGVIGYLASQNKGFKIALDKNGKVEIDVSADETFGQLLNRALEKNLTEVDAILVSHQYYNLANANLVDQLEHLDASKPETKEISNRLRRLLWDLRGPFEIPYTLIGADERMRKALDALELARKENKQASALLVELWKESLEGDGIFWPRSFNATVEIVRGAPTRSDDRNTVLVCPGDAVATVSGIIMSLSVGDGANAITAEVEQNPSLFHCDGSPLTAEKLLAEGGTPRLGLRENTFRDLVPASEPGTRDGRINATFQLYPKYMTGIGAQIGK
jgi:hypothetical protein